MNASVLEDRAVAADRTPPWLGAVVLPWLLSRTLLYVVAQHADAVHNRRWLGAYWLWDAGWYLRIAHEGYGFASARGETPYPFFPLLPWLLRVGEALGMSGVAAGIVLSNVVFLLALWGVYELARTHGTALEAHLAAWALAFYPGSAPLTLIYPCAIFLACAVWGFRALERERDGVAATLAAIAALSRPNGAVLALSLACGALLASGSWRRALCIALPAAACVLAWMAWLWTRTGDPLIFLHAKDAWHEVSLVSLLAGRDPLPKLDVAPLVCAVAVLALTWRRMAAAWLVFAALVVGPSLGLGILGMPRYVALCFPVFVGAGILLARVPAALRVAILTVMAAALLLFARRLLLGGQMP